MLFIYIAALIYSQPDLPKQPAAFLIPKKFHAISPDH